MTSGQKRDITRWELYKAGARPWISVTNSQSMGKVVLKMKLILLVVGLVAAHPKVSEEVPAQEVEADAEQEGRQNWGQLFQQFQQYEYENDFVNNWPSQQSQQTQQSQQSQPSQSNHGAPGDWLAQHNEKRRMHQNTPDLVSDPGLINKAQRCANGLRGSGGSLRHCSTGENLYTSYGMGGDLYQAAVDGWYDEAEEFGWRYGDQSFSGNTGHFTQVDHDTIPYLHHTKTK